MIRLMGIYYKAIEIFQLFFQFSIGGEIINFTEF